MNRCFARYGSQSVSVKGDVFDHALVIVCPTRSVISATPDMILNLERPTSFFLFIDDVE